MYLFLCGTEYKEHPRYRKSMDIKNMQWVQSPVLFGECW